MNQTTSSTAANQRSLVVPVSMLMGGNQAMIGQPGLPQVSGRLQSMQISPQMVPGPGQNRGMMPNPALMMDPLMVPMPMGNVGNLDPQLQADNAPQYSMQPMNATMNSPMNPNMDPNMNQGINPNLPPHMNPNLNPNMPPHMNPNMHQGPPLNLTPQPSYSGEYSNTVGGGTSLTEFTKRRNWSQRLLEELQDFLHILTPEMKIVYASPSGKLLTGYETEELLGRVMTDFIHADDAGLFIREFHESASTGQQLRMFYRFKKKDNTYVILETNGHPHFSEAQMQMAQQTGPKGFFMMARQYPTKNAALLDSFLEYKIEHERLTRRIAELRKEESDDQQQQIRQRQAQMQQRQQELGDSTPEQYSMTGSLSGNSVQKGNMPPPAKPGGVGNHTALTRQNLEIIDAANSNQAEASLHEKMARFGGGVTPGHIESIEMLTGLRYREGERSRGISTGDTSPSLIRGDVGVPIPMDKENRHTGEKKKKQKIADEYVCTDCGTLDSPEWRKGPKGPKTLCNACGLRWAKKEKRRNQGTSVSQSNIPPMAVGLNGVLPHGMTPS